MFTTLKTIPFKDLERTLTRHGLFLQGLDLRVQHVDRRAPEHHLKLYVNDEPLQGYFNASCSDLFSAFRLSDREDNSVILLFDGSSLQGVLPDHGDHYVLVRTLARDFRCVFRSDSGDRVDGREHVKADLVAEELRSGFQVIQGGVS